MGAVRAFRPDGGEAGHRAAPGGRGAQGGRGRRRHEGLGGHHQRHGTDLSLVSQVNLILRPGFIQFQTINGQNATKSGQTNIQFRQT